METRCRSHQAFPRDASTAASDAGVPSGEVVLCSTDAKLHLGRCGTPLPVTKQEIHQDIVNIPTKVIHFGNNEYNSSDNHDLEEHEHQSNFPVNLSDITLDEDYCSSYTSSATMFHPIDAEPIPVATHETSYSSSATMFHPIGAEPISVATHENQHDKNESLQRNGDKSEVCGLDKRWVHLNHFANEPAEIVLTVSNGRNLPAVDAPLILTQDILPNNKTTPNFN